MATGNRTHIEEELARIGDAVGALAQERAGYGTITALCVSMIDGTKAGYEKAMRTWFNCKLPKEWNASDLTALVEEWYNITRVPWDGGTEFWQDDVSAVSTGTKYGDNAGLVCTPSTDTVANVDDYAGHPCFAVKDCNWIIDQNTKDVLITAIDGITDNFERSNPAKLVGVLQMNMYAYEEETGKSFRRGLTSTKKNYSNIGAPFGVKYSDNTFRSFTIHGKYMMGLVNGKPTCCAGVAPRARDVSHNSEHTTAALLGSGYSCGTVTDLTFLKFMANIKYGSLTLDGILQGCCSHYYNNPALLPEQGVRRVLISANNANYPVGSRILIGQRGTSSDTGDRGSSPTYAISGAEGRRVTQVEQVTIDSTAYTALYVDGEPFDTVVDNETTSNTTYVRSWHWTAGDCDGVLGNDGSPVSCTNGKYPAKLQGIEFMVGGYEVLADVILKLYQGTEDTSKYYYEPYVCKDATKYSTSITADYEATGIVTEQPATSAWNYIVKEGYSPLGVLFPTKYTGGSSSTYTRDQVYLNAATVSTREWLAFGALSNGSSLAGLSCLLGSGSLSDAHWYLLGRLSPNGCRGELAA